MIYIWNELWNTYDFIYGEYEIKAYLNNMYEQPGNSGYTHKGKEGKGLFY